MAILGVIRTKNSCSTDTQNNKYIT